LTGNMPRPKACHLMVTENQMVVKLTTDVQAIFRLDIRSPSKMFG
jgi:hypothetical protein